MVSTFPETINTETVVDPADNCDQLTKQIADWLRLFVGPDQVTELRAFPTKADRDHPKVFGFFDGQHLERAWPGNMAYEAWAYSYHKAHRACPYQVYFVPNPLKPETLSRRKNYIASPMPKGGAGQDKDALARRYLMVDIDRNKAITPAHEKDSATDEEKQHTLMVATHVAAVMRDIGAPDPIWVDSGNGYHLYIPVVSEEGKDWAGVILKILAKLCDTNEAKVDMAVGNIATLMRVPGTMTRKGVSTTERPHRICQVMTVPETWRDAPMLTCSDLLERLKTKYPKVVASVIAGPTSQDPPPENGSQRNNQKSSQDITPWDDFDLRGDWQAILEPHGWQLESGNWIAGKLKRPGKDSGASATVGICKSKEKGTSLLYVFTSSTEFTPNTSYGKFRAFAILNHGGDSSAAAKALVKLGYGSKKGKGKQKRRGRPEQQPNLDTESLDAKWLDETLEEIANEEKERKQKKATARGERTNDDGEDEEEKEASQIITEYFREVYKPVFRRGNVLFGKDNREIKMNEATTVTTSVIIARLQVASNAQTDNEGEVKINTLPRLFNLWAKNAWGDLLATLPEEDVANLGEESEAAETFRRMVREAMFTEVVLGETVRRGEVTQTERRSLIEWCNRFAKPGRWESIRSKRCWCKLKILEGSEVQLMIGLRHDLFSQLKADRRLIEMPSKRFARLAEQYGVSKKTEDDRCSGVRAIILDPEFIRDLLTGLPDDPDDFQAPSG